MGMNRGVLTSDAPASTGCGGTVRVAGVPSGVPPSTQALMVAFCWSLRVVSSWKLPQLPSWTRKYGGMVPALTRTFSIDANALASA